MNWDEIQSQWPEIKKRLSADRPDLDPDTMEQTEDGRRRLLLLIEAKYESGRPVAASDLDDVVNDDGAGRGVKKDTQ